MMLKVTIRENIPRLTDMILQRTDWAVGFATQIIRNKITTPHGFYQPNVFARAQDINTEYFATRHRLRTHDWWRFMQHSLTRTFIGRLEKQWHWSAFRVFLVNIGPSQSAMEKGGTFFSLIQRRWVMSWSHEHIWFFYFWFRSHRGENMSRFWITYRCDAFVNKFFLLASLPKFSRWRGSFEMHANHSVSSADFPLIDRGYRWILLFTSSYK